MPRATSLPTGVRIERGHYRLYAEYRGRKARKRMPLDTTRQQLVDERKKLIAALTLEDEDAPATPEPGTLAADVAAYLALIKDEMPGYQTRKTQLDAWIQALGADTPREKITARQIDAILAGWQASKHWSGSTVNHYRTAIGRLYSRLDGRSGKNPTRDVPKRKETEPGARGLPPEWVEAIFAAMPGRELKLAANGIRQFAPSQARAFLRVVYYCGMPPAQVRQLAGARLHAKQLAIEMPGRKKGKGTEPRVRALTEQGLAAIQEALALPGALTVTEPSCLLSFRRAVATVRAAHPDWAIPFDVRPYDLRHSFGTWAYRVTRSLPAVQGLMDHKDPKTTLRYVRGAVNEVEAAAAAQVGAALKAALAPTPSAQKSAPTTRTRQKSKRQGASQAS